MKTLGKTGYDGNNIRNMNTLAGGDYEWMVDAGFKPKNLIPYNYPKEEEFIAQYTNYLSWVVSG